MYIKVRIRKYHWTFLTARFYYFFPSTSSIIITCSCVSRKNIYWIPCSCPEVKSLGTIFHHTGRKNKTYLTSTHNLYRHFPHRLPAGCLLPCYYIAERERVCWGFYTNVCRLALSPDTYFDPIGSEEKITGKRLMICKEELAKAASRLLPLREMWGRKWISYLRALTTVRESERERERERERENQNSLSFYARRQSGWWRRCQSSCE